MIGQTLGGYRITEQIGMGGMATVYKAYDAGTDRYVALKLLPAQYSNDEVFRERFKREAKAIAKLEHMHILPIFAYGEENGTAYLVMRYMEAGTLSDRLRQGRLSLDEINRLITQIADALDTAHERGILHRDVKPSNVLLDSRGNTYLTDFGIAKMLEGTTDLTAGGMIGTPKYMSPEQCQGANDLTAASDQYSLGIMLYEMVIGKAPFDAETPLATIYKHLNEPLPLPSKIDASIPESVERVLLKALAKDPSQRFPSCGAMAEAFAKAIVDAPTKTLIEAGHHDLTMDVSTVPMAMPPAAATSTVKAPRSSGMPSGVPPWIWIVAAGGIVGLIAIVGIGLLLTNLLGSAAQESPTEEPAILENTPADSTVPTSTSAPVAEATVAEAATEVVPTDAPIVESDFEDHFDAPTLADGWSWISENPSAWSLTEPAGSLMLETTSTGILLEGGDAPLLLRRAPEGDFTIQVKLTFQPDENYEAAGLLAFASYDQLVAASRAFCDWCGGDQAYFDNDEAHIGGTVDYTHYVGGLPANAPIYLRLERAGNTYTGYWSTDGEAWTMIATDEVRWTPTHIGLFAVNSYVDAAPIPAVFDDFQVFTAAP